METTKTTILPHESDQALQAFKKLVHDEPKSLFVVLGEGPLQEKLVERADSLAGNADEWRWVVWARRPDHIKGAIKELKGASKLGDLVSVVAFMLSLTDEVVDVIKLESEAPSLIRIQKAYLKGEVES